MKQKCNLLMILLIDVLFFNAASLFVSCGNSSGVHQRAEILESAPNFRDLGGYVSTNGKQTAWGKVFRSQAFAQLNDRDINKIKEMGIKTVIDFRDDGEVRKAPSRLPDGINVIRLPIGVGNNDTVMDVIQSTALKQLDSLQCIHFMEEINRKFVTEFVPQYKAFFDILLKPENYPVVFHCTAGKDRTGFAAAMLLSALDVNWNTVMEDYLLTNKYLKLPPLPQQIPEKAMPVIRQLWGVRASYLNTAKDEIIKRYKSIDNYLQKELNIGKEEKKKLAKYLTL
jgi:protein-tyrosine phosphatase